MLESVPGCTTTNAFIAIYSIRVFKNSLKQKVHTEHSINYVLCTLVFTDVSFKRFAGLKVKVKNCVV